MDRWAGKIAVVTGASAGIGTAVARDLTNAGMIVIGLARRVERLEQIKSSLAGAKGQFHFYACDTGNLESIKVAFAWIKEKFGRLHVLVNNAGITKNTSILAKDNEQDLKELIDVNLMGYVYCTKQAYGIMIASDEDCHIINIGSILGSKIPLIPFSERYNLYPPSKFAVNATGDVLRQELRDNKKFRVTTINPGLVKTEIAKAAKVAEGANLLSTPGILNPEEIAKSVIFVLELPRHALVTEMTIRSTSDNFY